MSTTRSKSTSRPSRAAKEAAVDKKLWLEGVEFRPAANPPGKQTRVTDIYPVRKGPAPETKTRKAAVPTAAIAVETTTIAPRGASALERTAARAARTSAVVNRSSSRGRKRAEPATSEDEAILDADTESADEAAAAQPAAAAAIITTAPAAANGPAPRRSTRKAAAPAQPAAPAAPPVAPKKPSRAPAAAPPSTSAPTRRRGTRSAAPRFLSSYEVNGEEYRIGQDVYVVETDDTAKLPLDEEDEDCCVCGRNTNAPRMVECDRCLRGFHFRCLKPPLKKLPEGDWLCPDCEAGVPPSAAGRRLTTSSQAFLFGDRILGLAHVTGWEARPDGQMEVTVRHYLRPEETHMGRQKHHASREVFLGVVEHVEAVQCIWGRAQVVRPDRFTATDGTDVFVCEYEYDDRWKRFRRRIYPEDGPAGAASDDDDEWRVSAAAAGPGGRRKGAAAAPPPVEDSTSEGEDSDDGGSDRDVEYKPLNTLDGWVIRKPRPGQQRTSGRARTAGRAQAYKAILDEQGTGLLLHDGAAAVPERAPVSALAAARRALALNNCAGGLPCREAEKAVLRRFVGQAVEEGGDSPGVLYICGVPGTGKTACCMEVLGGVRHAAQASGVQLVILNALQLPSPQHVYSKLWERMSGQRWGPARALGALEEAFSGGVQRAGNGLGGGASAGGRRHVTLLIVDEIDVLITKDQAVLYNLFEWPLREGSRLAVIGISNTHDLDSRVLPRIASRLSGSKLAFNPYNFEQLKEILNTRLQGTTAVAKGAVEFCARKVASTTGDVRRALELLRRAAEIAEAERAAKARVAQAQGAGGSGAGGAEQADWTNAVTAREASLAIREMYGAAHMALLRGCGLHAKLVLTALLVEGRAQGRHEVTAASVHHRLASHLALLMPGAALPLCRVVEAAAGLGAQRLLLTEPGWQGPAMRLALNVPQDDVVAVLRGDTAIAPLQSCLV